jgi:hypothetical protein
MQLGKGAAPSVLRNNLCENRNPNPNPSPNANPNPSPNPNPNPNSNPNPNPNPNRTPDLRKTMEDHLTEDERAVVALRFGLEDGDTRTVRGCGEELGISRARTSPKGLASWLASRC